MTGVHPNDSDPLAVARRCFEASVEHPERLLEDLPELLDLLSMDAAAVTAERRLARREAASGALANLASHDPARLADATPTLIAQLRVELDRPRSADDRSHSARSVAVREHLVSSLAGVLLVDVEAIGDPDDLGVVVDSLSPGLDDGTVRRAMRALVAVTEEHPERLVPSVGSLATLLDHPDPTVAALCAGVLGRLAERRPEAVAGHAADLGVLLGRDDETVQHNAVEALAAVARQRPDAVAPLAKPLRGLLSHDSVAIQHNATGVLGLLAEANPAVVRPAIDDIRTLCDHDTAAVRRVAVGTLARLRRADSG
jgi:hypothetical protein